MKYKMLVMDMDGTLLTDDKKISPANKKALEKAADLGVKIVVSTGRIFVSAKVYGEMIGVNTPIIASNGAYIREKDRDEVIYARPFGEANIRDALRLTQKHGVCGHFFTPDTIFTEKLVYNAINYTRWNEQMPEDKQVKVVVVNRGGWDDVIEKNKDAILKVVVTDESPDRIRALREDISTLQVEISSSIVYNNQYNIEVMDKGVTKGNAVSVLEKIYRLDRSEIICIGDSENDISMIKYAGLGIAMENATEDAKEAADFITLSNQDDGVAYAIEKFILS